MCFVETEIDQGHSSCALAENVSRTASTRSSVFQDGDVHPVIKLNQTDFLIPFACSGSDDDLSVAYWNHYYPNQFEFSSNIQILHATRIAGSGAVVVGKKDPNIREYLSFFDPQKGDLTFSF